MADFQISEIEIPVAEETVESLIAFWEGIFKVSYQDFRGPLRGEEVRENLNILYLTHQDSRLVGTTQLTISRAVPVLAGLGEVATDPEFRGRGIASLLSARARDEFRRRGGQGLFLATENPVAAKLYQRLGWRKLPGANVMLNATFADSPEEFLADYFRRNDDVLFHACTSAHRIPMIPLIVSPHDRQLLDINTGICSTRYAVQTSCMGLYPRYARLSRGASGAWFGASTRDGRLVGISSAIVDTLGHVRVDGFTHHSYQDRWGDLMNQSIAWGFSRGAPVCYTRLSIEDDEKWSLFEALGFQRVSAPGAVSIAGRVISLLRLEKHAPYQSATSA